MRATQISQYSWQLTRLGFINSYLVRESDSFTLIDTGVPGGAKAILKHARKAGAPIARILLTHAHGDHVGSVDALGKALGKTDLAISTRESRLLPKKPAQDRSLDPGEPPCKIKGSLPGVRTVPTHLLSVGELFGSLRCLSTPGHTPGHFSFVDERDGTLYAGDALVTIGGKPRIAGWAPWYFALPNFATWHRPTARESVEQLLSADRSGVRMQRIAPGHGRVLEGGRELLQAALDQAR